MEEQIKEIKKEIDVYLKLKEETPSGNQRHYFLGILEGLYKALEILEKVK